MRKISKREPVWTGCVERSLRWVFIPCMREVIPTPPQAIEVKMGVFVTSLVKVGNTVV